MSKTVATSCYFLALPFAFFAPFVPQEHLQPFFAAAFLAMTHSPVRTNLVPA
jgi:hypothetical protein